MITVNGRAADELGGQDVRAVIEARYPYARIYVKYNGEHVEPEAYPRLRLKDGDALEVIHLMAGG